MKNIINKILDNNFTELEISKEINKFNEIQKEQLLTEIKEEYKTNSNKRLERYMIALQIEKMVKSGAESFILY